jgi:hypothetical protein
MSDHNVFHLEVAIHKDSLNYVVLKSILFRT